MKWDKMPMGLLGGGNETLQGKDFHISYNPCPGFVISWFGSDTGGPETALCKGNKFYILNGDHRAAYEKIVHKGFKACLAFFREKEKTSGSSWTSLSAQRESIE